MATAWDVPAVGWAIIVVGWWISPFIAFFLPKIFSFLEFDMSQKVRGLRIDILPELESTLLAVDRERMLGRGNKPNSTVSILEDMAGWLRHAREDAEDIFDDAQEIELYRNTCSQQLYSAAKACIVVVYGAVEGCIARCLGYLQKQLDGVVATCKSSCVRLQQWTGKIFRGCRHGLCGAVESICRMWIAGVTRMRSPQDVLPVTSGVVASDQSIPETAPSGGGAVSDRSAPVTTTAVSSSSDRLVPVTTTAEASVEPPVLVTNQQILRVGAAGAVTSDEPPALVTALSCLCSFFHLIKNWFGIAVGLAYFLRDWPYEVLGIKSNQENASALDSLLTAISRRNLKKRIEKVESTVSEVKKSKLLGVASKSTPDDIANKNRSKIRNSSNRKVFGREALRDSIMAKLREKPHGTSPCYSAIGIYGVAGSGKTTFAQYIRDYIEEQCKEEELFQAIMCIHVSETFSVDDIFHEMLKDITKDRHSNVLDREELEEKLKESLRGKRFCLILDDLWVKTKNDQQLEEIISPLSVGLEGSKILVTARTKVAAGALCADEPIEMPELDEDKYLSMFMHYARGCKSVIDEEYTQFGSVIAEKLHRSPIAAVIVAGRLGANQDINFWKITAKHGMLNDTMDALWWSYQQLNSDIRRCFEYCNIFPRRFEIKRGDLVHLWMAQGFVKTSCGTEDMEDVAKGYIQELVSCSFLQPEKNQNDEEFFRIHDLLHDLADMVTRTDCFRIENESGQRGGSWKGDIPRDVRHLFVQNYDVELITKKIIGLGNLRTLIINYGGRDTKVEEVIDSVCKKLQKLRVFAFAWSKAYIAIKKQRELSVPESVGQLKHLRYLAVRTYPCHEIILPTTLNKLQHIQLLDFGDGEILEFTFAKLVNLRHILHGHVKPIYVGRLSSLQSLPDFEVSNEQGCELKQLRGLNKLRGKLCISGLENVKSKEEALEANLVAKERLTELTLEWGYDDDTRCSPDVEADVLEGLCPPAGLQNLDLCYFAGWRYPDWMVGKHRSGPKCLQELYLLKCSQPVPASGLAEAFPHLRVLWYCNCSWDALPENMEHLTSLKNLIIDSCKNIRSLPTLPQSLEVFLVKFCHNEFRKSCETEGHPNWQKIEHIPIKGFL